MRNPDDLKKTLKALEQTIQEEKEISFEMIFSVINVSKEIRSLSSRLEPDNTPSSSATDENLFMTQVKEMVCENIHLAEMSLRYALSIQELKKKMYLIETELNFLKKE